jgi:hypothetical protein
MKHDILRWCAVIVVFCLAMLQNLLLTHRISGLEQRQLKLEQQIVQVSASASTLARASKSNSEAIIKLCDNSRLDRLEVWQKEFKWAILKLSEASKIHSDSIIKIARFIEQR